MNGKKISIIKSDSPEAIKNKIILENKKDINRNKRNDSIRRNSDRKNVWVGKYKVNISCRKEIYSGSKRTDEGVKC